MAVTREIMATYRGPGRVIGRLLGMGLREDRALAILMAGCVIVFVAQWPRQAHLEGAELNMLLGSTLLAWVFVAPLMLYVLAQLSHWIARAIGAKGTSFGARLALFWALLAASPLMLLYGLIAGFIGPSVGLQAVGVLWLAVFGWFWLAGLYRAEWGETA